MPLRSTLRTLALWAAVSAAATLATPGCTLFGGDTVTLSGTNFESQIDRAQNLRFTFAQNIVSTAQVGVWDTTEYVRIEPKVPGRFQWTGPNELVFSPAGSFGASQDYTATLTDEIGKADSSGNTRRVESATLNFHTPYLDIASAQSYWSRDGSGAAQARVKLRFNYRVSAAQVAELAKVQVDGQEVAATLVAGAAGAGEEVSLALAPFRVPRGENLTVAVEIAPGLKTSESAWVSKAPILYNVNFPLSDVLVVSNVEAEHGGNEGTIHVYTTQALVEGQVARHVRVQPQVNYRVEVMENGLRLRGDFDPQTTYTLYLDKGLTGVLGTTLGQDFEQQVQFRELGEAIAFASVKGMYLSSAGSRNIAVRIAGVQKVNVKITKVYQNNILAFLRAGTSYGYDYSEDTEEYHNWEYYDTELFGDVILQRQYDVQTLPRNGGVRLLALDFVDTKPQYPGFFVVEVGSAEKLWVRASKVLSISDIGLIARRSGNDIVVFANSIHTAEPLPDIALQLVSTNNQNVYQAKTDRDGVAWFRDLATHAPGFQSAMVTAAKGDGTAASDFNYLLLGQSRVETSRFEVGGRRRDERPYDAFLYGDREIYRPGDTVYLNSIVRSFDWETVRDMPVKLKVLLPNGREFVTQRGVLSAQGSFSTQFALPQAAATGTYQLELHTGSDKLLASKGISVEEFLPDKIRVKLTTTPLRAEPSQDVAADILADNLYGTPASYRNYEVQFTLRRGSFTPKGLEQFHFGLRGLPGEPERDRWSGDYAEDVTNVLATVQRSGRTDAQGKAREVFADLEQYQNIGLVQGRIYASVFDESGRPVNRAQTVELFTQRVFFGLGPFGTYVAPRRPVRIPLAAVSDAGKPLKAQARIQVVKNNWETVIEREYGRYRYTSKKRVQTLVDRLVDVDGANGAFEFTPSQNGEYEVRISKPGAAAYVGREFYSYGWGDDGSASSFEVSTDGNVIIEADKAQYTTGETANILFKTPFEGRLLVTVERDAVIEHRYLRTEGNAANMSLKLDDKHLPNVYVTATLIRPMDGADPSLPLTVAHGFAPVKVDAPSRKLPVQIAAAAKSTSRTTQTVTVTTRPGAEVTVAVVDEGILQIKNTATPAPYDFFYAKRALEVDPFDLYAALLPELRGGSASSPGGDGYDLSRRVNPLTDKRVKLIALWSGTRKADGNGVVRFPVRIPQFAGALRVMAVAYDGAAFGSAEHEMQVADPVVITTALPRFLSPGDTLTVPVTLANTTARAATATARIRVSGPVRVMGSSTAQASLAANGETRLQFQLVAQQAIGGASVNVQVQALGGTYTESIDLPVRPAATLTKQYAGGTVEAGQSAAVDLTGGGLLAATRQGRLLVSRSPLVQYARALDELIGYPHGCIEQTVARAFPQLYYADLVKAVGRPGETVQTPQYNVTAAIAKIQSMQQYDGSMSYWPGGQESSWWGSAFASHFLFEAERAGYEVSDAVQRRLVDYLERKLADRTETTVYFLDGSYRKAPARETFYSLYVLALQGRGQLSTMNYYKADVAPLTPDSRYLLASAYALVGDKGSYQRLLPQPAELEAQLSQPLTGGSFASPIRDRAIALYTLLEVDARNNQVPTLARNLSQAMNQRAWLNTQESVFGFLALGRFARLNAGNDASGTLRYAGKTVSLNDLGSRDYVLAQGIAGQQATLAAEDGPLYWFTEVSGIPTSGVPEVDNRLRIRRTLYDRNGNVLAGRSFRQNDLVVVRLSVSAPENDEVENVVATDLLPAGFEIENPRISELPELAWIRDAATPEHLDIRDDRVHFYTDLPSGGRERHFYYVVRAVSPGRFRQGPASADAMYRGDYYSYHGAGTVTVLPNTPKAGL